MIGALEKKGYRVVPIEVGKNFGSLTLVSDLMRNPIDVAVIALHGKLGEDGTVQGLLEYLAIPYTGSGVMASAVGMNKILTKRIAQAAKIKTPPFLTFQVSLDSYETFEKKIKFPVMIKAQAEGSTRGTMMVKEKKDLKKAVEEAAQYDEYILAEAFIEGPQITAGILIDRVLPLIEIVPKSGFFDYHAKYTKGATEYLIPARVSQKTAAAARETALRMFHLLQCRGYARADFMVDSEGTPWFIEINTLPGMTETSLVPMAAEKEGLSFENLVEKILNCATLDHAKIQNK